MTKPRKTAFDLEAMIAAEMLLLGEGPLGIPLSVKPLDADGSWAAVSQTDDPQCLADIGRIEANLRAQYDLEMET